MHGCGYIRIDEGIIYMTMSGAGGFNVKVELCLKCMKPIRITSMQVGKGPVLVKCQNCWSEYKVVDGKLVSEGK